MVSLKQPLRGEGGPELPLRPALGPPPAAPVASGNGNRAGGGGGLTLCSPQEQAQLYVRSGAVSPATFQQPGRQVKLWVKMVTPLIKNFF